MPWWLSKRWLRKLTSAFALATIWPSSVILATRMFIPRVRFGDPLKPGLIVHSGVVLVLIVGVRPGPRASAVVSSAAGKVPRLISVSVATLVAVAAIAAVIVWVAVLVIVLLGAHSRICAKFNIILKNSNFSY